MGQGTETLERTRDRGKHVQKMHLDSDEIAERKASQRERREERRAIRRAEGKTRRAAAALDVEGLA